MDDSAAIFAQAFAPQVNVRPSLCENAKVPGFRVSLYPSRVAARPIRRDLKGRFSRTPHSACVFTQARPFPSTMAAAALTHFLRHTARLAVKLTAVTRLTAASIFSDGRDACYGRPAMGTGRWRRRDSLLTVVARSTGLRFSGLDAKLQFFIFRATV